MFPASGSTCAFCLNNAQLPDEMESARDPNLNNLPPELTTRILSYLSFDEIADFRKVCRSFNECGKSLLNKGAQKILDVTRIYMNKANSDLPRGPEQWGDVEIIEPLTPKYKKWAVVRTSIGCLYLLYRPYISNGSSCFVAGKVLDLANAILVSDSINFNLIDALGFLDFKAESHFKHIIIPRIVTHSFGSTNATADYSTLPTGNKKTAKKQWPTNCEGESDLDEEKSTADQRSIFEMLGKQIEDLVKRFEVLEKRIEIIEKFNELFEEKNKFLEKHLELHPYSGCAQ